MTILVTGARGMIGSALCDGLAQAGYRVVGVDRAAAPQEQSGVSFVQLDLADEAALAEVIRQQQVDRVIHLAALAHTAGEDDLSWEKYEHVNVACASNVFRAGKRLPVLCISTVDVFGFVKEPVDGTTPVSPVTHYGRSKAMAEDACRQLCDRYSIYRLSPVYTPQIKRDIQKRYYLKHPHVAYRIGKGSEFEVLDIRRAVQEMVAWCALEPAGEVRIIKDDEPLRTAEVIRSEKAEGRARFVVWLPAWLVRAGYVIARAILGDNKYTYLLHKAVWPLRSK